MMGHSTAGLLIAAAAGYWVFERGSTRKDPIRRIGQWVGGAIMVISLVGVACRVWYVTTGSGWCDKGKGGKQFFCPWSPSSPQGASPVTTPEAGRR